MEVVDLSIPQFQPEEKFYFVLNEVPYEFSPRAFCMNCDSELPLTKRIVINQNYLPKSLEAFIKCLNNEAVPIKEDNLYDLLYLSKEFHFTKLIKIIEQKIKDRHDNEAIINELINRHKSGMETSFLEDIIVNSINECFESGTFLKLEIEIITRILANVEMKSDKLLRIIKELEKTNIDRNKYSHIYSKLKYNELSHEDRQYVFSNCADKSILSEFLCDYVQDQKKTIEEKEQIINSYVNFSFGCIYNYLELPTQAFKYYEKASSQMNSFGQLIIGLSALKGNFVEESKEKAIELLKMSVKQGNMLSQYILKEYSPNYSDITHSSEWPAIFTEQCNTDAQCMVAYMYYNGMFLEKDYQKAFNLFKLAADKGNSDAQCMIGCIYYEGNLGQQNCNDAFDYFKKSADQGNSVAQRKIGLMYYKGDHGSDLTEAFRYFKMSADQGDSISRCMVGKMYYKGESVQVNLEESYKYFVMAADPSFPEKQIYSGKTNYKVFHLDSRKEIDDFIKKGEIDAIDKCIVGTLYFKGEYLKKNDNVAHDCFKESAEKSCKIAERLLDTYFTKKDVKKDDDELATLKEKADKDHDLLSVQQVWLKYYQAHKYQKAFKYLMMAHEKNPDNFSRLFLGIMYKRGLWVKKDYKQAINYFQLITGGECFAQTQYHYGDLLMDKTQETYNPEEGLKKLKSSADNGCKLAIGSLATYYFEGVYDKNGNVVLQRDLSTAVQKAELSHEEHGYAAYILGITYQSDQPKGKDMYKSFMYLKESAKLGFDLAFSHVGKFYRYKNEYISKNLRKAFKWFTRGADIGDFVSQYELAKMYSEGKYVEKNPREAFEWMKKSADSGYDEAEVGLAKMFALGTYVDKNYEEAYILCKKVVESSKNDSIHYKQAMKMLAEMYYHGLYVDKDVNKGLSMFRELEEANYNYVWPDLCTAYLLGEGVQKDLNKSLEYLIKGWNYMHQNDSVASIYAIFKDGYNDLKEEQIDKALQLLLERCKKGRYDKWMKNALRIIGEGFIPDKRKSEEFLNQLQLIF